MLALWKKYCLPISDIFFLFYSLANWTMIKQLISNDQWSGTIFGIEGAADRKFSFQGVHNVEQSMRLLT